MDLENLAEVIDLWIPSSGYSYLIVKLLPNISLSIVLAVSNESVTVRLAFYQSMDKPAHYNHPIVEYGWMCALLWESVTTFWAKNLDEEELLNRLKEVHNACLMREVLDEVSEVDGMYGALLASTWRFHRVKVDDEGSSSTLSITVMRPLPLHLTSLNAAARKYDLAGCYSVTHDQSLVYTHHYKGKEWLQKLLMEEVRASRDGG